MNKLNTVAKIITKILEVIHWISAIFMAVCGGAAVIAPDMLYKLVDVESLKVSTDTSVYGFDVNVLNAAGEFDTVTFALFSAGAFVIFVAVAMIFRNINIIIKKSENSTPFQSDNIRMLREIGIFSIAIPIVGLIITALIRIINPDIEASVNQSGIIMGIIVLCLTQVFVRGAEMEKDVDGLV